MNFLPCTIMQLMEEKKKKEARGGVSVKDRVNHAKKIGWGRRNGELCVKE